MWWLARVNTYKNINCILNTAKNICFLNCYIYAITSLRHEFTQKTPMFREKQTILQYMSIWSYFSNQISHATTRGGQADNTQHLIWASIVCKQQNKQQYCTYVFKTVFSALFNIVQEYLKNIKTQHHKNLWGKSKSDMWKFFTKCQSCE